MAAAWPGGGAAWAAEAWWAGWTAAVAWGGAWMPTPWTIWRMKRCFFLLFFFFSIFAQLYDKKKNITAEQMIEKVFLSSRMSLNSRLIELLSPCDLKCIAPNHKPKRHKTKVNSDGRPWRHLWHNGISEVQRDGCMHQSTFTYSLRRSGSHVWSLAWSECWLNRENAWYWLGLSLTSFGSLPGSNRGLHGWNRVRQS